MQLWIASFLFVLFANVITASKPWPPGCYPKQSMCKRKCGQSGNSCSPHSQMGRSWWKCKPVHCDRLTAPLHGAVDMTGTVFESRASYSCEKGYHLSKPISRTCLSTGKWSAYAPTCEFDPDCGSLPEPTHGHVHYSHGHHFESIATYSCDIHFELSSPKTRVCQASGQWSDCAPTCEPIVDCGLLHDPEHGLAHHPFGTWLESVAHYTCRHGYDLHGSAERVCLEDGWTGSKPTCDPIECYPVQAPCDGFVVTPSGDQLGDKAHYSCEFGYVLHGDEVRECLADGHWSSHMPCCEIADCGYPDEPEYGHVETPSGHSVGDSAHYWCDPCYTLTGPLNRVCQANGKWSEMDPVCEETAAGYNKSYMNSCYKFYDVETRWLQAVAACKDDGAKLVEIETAGENQYLAECLKTRDSGGPFNGGPVISWIGLYDEMVEEQYIWESTQQETCYANWDHRINEPNDLHNNAGEFEGGADCVAMLEDYSFEWRTRHCLATYYYVCEIDHDDP